MNPPAIPDDNACGEMLTLAMPDQRDLFLVCVLDRHSHGLHSDVDGSRWGSIDPRSRGAGS